MTDLQKDAVEGTQFWIDYANELYDLSIKCPPVSFKLRGSTAGQARYSSLKNDEEIRYNAVLLEENGKDFLDRTVPHEVAHIVVRHKFSGRRKPHGYEWKSVMRDFGLSSKRCHSYDTTNSRQSRGRMPRPFIYVCSCREHNVTKNIHNKMLRGQRRYCKLCRTNIEFKEMRLVA